MLSAILGGLIVLALYGLYLVIRNFMSKRSASKVEYTLLRKTAHGINVTKRMQELGAPTLRDGDKYGFFETAYQKNDGYYDDYAVEVGPAIVILSDSNDKDVVYLAKIADTKDLSKGFLEAAKEAYKPYRKDVEKALRKERIRKFAEGKPFNEMTILGDSTEWKED